MRSVEISFKQDLEQAGCNCSVRFAAKVSSVSTEFLLKFQKFLYEGTTHATDYFYRARLKVHGLSE